MISSDLPLAPAAPSQFRTLTLVALAMVALALLWSLADARVLDGAPVWMKPLKFALSFALLFGTLALVEARLSAPVRTGATLRIVAWVMTAAFLSEMAYMTYQAALGEASHFNLSTPFNAVMYGTVMAAGAVALVASVAVIGWCARRDAQAALGPATREGIWLGFQATFVLTMIVAGYMSGQPGHHVGLHPEGAATIPLFGWSGAVGDLRPAHFASLHAMQALPLLGLLLDARGGGVTAIRVAAIAYGAVTLAVFAQALMGLPLIPLG
ncbi:hypothetical protein N9W17_01730 [Jannaschia sp.]|nr:hypothetical protein [Jannaschia sp.]